MFTSRRFQFFRGIRWTFNVIPPMIIWSGLLVALHLHADLEWIRLPTLPVTVLGTAVAFYLGFKGNSAYDRLWEARKIWGGIVNTSRTWGVHVIGMVTDRHGQTEGKTPLSEVHRELLYRHLAWLGALRVQLRRRKQWEHSSEVNDERRRHYDTIDTSDERLREAIAPFVPADELDGLMAQKNRATQLVRIQSERLRDLRADGRIDDFRHMELAELLEELFNLQGKCERIKNFPLPRQYATANHWFVVAFIALLPLALLGTFHHPGVPEFYAWGTVPASVIVGWVFYTWNMVVEYSENPFEGLVNDIPMNALSRTIEIDLREMLGETELPPGIQPIDGSVLM